MTDSIQDSIQIASTFLISKWENQNIAFIREKSELTDVEHAGHM